MQYTVTLPAVQSARYYGDTWDGSRLTAGMYSSTKHRGFIRFGEWPVPSYATLVSATVRFYVSDDYSPSYFTFTWYPVTDNGTLWTEDSRNGASTSSVATASSRIGSSGNWHTANILAIAQAWQSGTADPTRGVCLTSGTSESYKVISKWNSANPPTLTVVYDIPASVPSTDKDNYTMGETVNVSIEPVEEGVSHTVDYFVAGETDPFETQSLDVGVLETSWTIPTNDEFGGKFPNSATTSLIIRVTTTLNGEERGYFDIETSMGVPSDSAPHGVCEPIRTGANEIVEVYIQRQNGVTFNVTATPKYGALIESIQVSFEGVTISGASAALSAEFEVINGSGEIPYTYTVTDSRGLTFTGNDVLSVLPWTAPQISVFKTDRASESGTPSIGGTYVLATVGLSVSPLELSGVPENTLSYSVRYRKSGTEDWIDTDVVLSDATAENLSYLLTSDGAAISEFEDLSGYEFVLVVSDLFTYSSAMDEIPTAEMEIDIHRRANSIAFGMKSTATDKENSKFEVAQRAYFYGGIEGAGTTYSEEEQLTGDTWIDGKPIYRRVLTAKITGNGSKVIGNIGTGIETFLVMRGQFKSGSDNWRPFPNGYYGGINYMTGFLYEINTGDVRVQFGTQISGTSEFVIIFEYTKV